MELDSSGINNELICIEYPGVVNNVDKMLDTLGGLPEISKIVQSPNRRLELRFRPDDVYCKPVCGNKFKSNSLLLRVKIKLLKDKETGETRSSGSIHVVGRVKDSFKFKSLCDFQFLPMDITPEGKVTDLSKQIFPQDVSGDNLSKWLETPIVNFFPPPAFARVDNLATNSYMYRGCANDESENSTVIGRTRKRESGHAIFVYFDVKNVPNKPKEKALKFLEVKMLDKQYQMVKECFDRRPLWSKLALMCVTQLSHDSLKYVLPATSYYFVTGPFRIMWVRFGYDPRINPENKIYQTLDFRMRSLDGLTSAIKAKRATTNYFLPNKMSHASPKTTVISKKELDPNASSSKTPVFRGDEHIFTPTSIPPTRQMFYQYIDLKLPEIESLFARLPKNPETGYDPRTGFLPRGFDVHCRNVITSYIAKNLKQEQGIENYEEGEGEDSCDDDEDDESWQVERVEDEIDISDDE